MGKIENTLQEALIEWEGRSVRLTYQSEYFSEVAHLEIRSDDGEPLPITSTGYKSHFFMAKEPPSLSAVEIFASGWLIEEAQSKEWKAYQITSRQMELF